MNINCVLMKIYKRNYRAISYRMLADFDWYFRWDILNTINADTEIENERDEAMMNATLLLMRNMEGNGDINKTVVDKATQKFRR